MGRLARAFYVLDREKLLKEQGNKCFYCKKNLTKKTATMDHVIPKSKTKYHSTANCVVACQQCNQKKAAKEIKKIPVEKWEWTLIKGLNDLDEMVRKIEWKFDDDSKGSYAKWKKYWTKRNRWS